MVDNASKPDDGQAGKPADGQALMFDLSAESAVLRRHPSWETNGHNAKTLVKTPDLRVVLVVMKDGARIKEHRTDHRFSLQTIVGRVRVKLPQQTLDVTAGMLAVLERNTPHDVEAQGESAFLLSMTTSRK